jgi:hypothetical protein
MDNISQYIFPGVVTLVTTVFASLLIMYIRPKAKVRYWRPHSFLHDIPEPNNKHVFIRTEAITLQNLGRENANNIQLTFKKKPDHFSIDPPSANIMTQFCKFDNDVNEYFVINIASLAPRELITVQILNFQQDLSLLVSPLLNVRSAAGKAECIPVQIAKVLPRWFVKLAYIIMIIGIICTIYLLVKLIVLTYYWLTTTLI